MKAEDYALTKPSYTVNEIIALGCCGGRTTMYAEIKAGRLRTVSRGKSTLVLLPGLVNYLNYLRENPNE